MKIHAIRTGSVRNRPSRQIGRGRGPMAEARRTIQRIRWYATTCPTVYLPSHAARAMARLESSATIEWQAGAIPDEPVTPKPHG